MVTRCICFNRSFTELKRLARRKKAKTLEQLQKCVTFGENCRRCHPYVERMLRTGETVFEVLPRIPSSSAPDE